MLAVAISKVRLKYARVGSRERRLHALDLVLDREEVAAGLIDLPQR
jgi:hypothetical protein